MGRQPGLSDEEFDRRLSKDVDDNWAGILVDAILQSADALRAEVRRDAHRRPERSACATEVEPLVERIRQDGRNLKEILVKHGLIPVLSGQPR